MSLLKRKDGIFEADVRDRRVKRLHVSLATTNKAEATRLYAAVVALVREGDPELVDLLRKRVVHVQAVARCVRERRPFSDLRPSAAWPTVAVAADRYLDWLGAHPEREAATARVARGQLRHFVAEFGDRPLDRVPLVEAAAWQQRLVASAAVNSVRVIVGRVVALYAWHAAQEQRHAVAEGRHARPLVAPLDPDTRPTRSTARERFLTRTEAALLMEACPDAFRAHIAVGLLAGLRISEVLWLRPEQDVDLAHDLLIVQARGEKGAPDYWRPKTGERREVPIGADLRVILVDHLEHYASDAYVFPGKTRPEAPLNDDECRKQFRRVVRAAGLTYGRADAEGVLFHTLRHTFASWLMQADVNPVRIAKLLGNSLDQVMNTYGHLAPKDNRGAVALLNGVVPLPTIETTVLAASAAEVGE